MQSSITSSYTQHGLIIWFCG